MTACPLPPGISKCLPTQTYVIGGVDYYAFQLCDQANKTTILAVYQLCNGAISGLPTYFDLQGNPYVPVGAVGACADSMDYETLCDVGTNPNTQILALWDATTVPPSLSYYTPGTTGALVPYTPIGPVSACPQEDMEDTQVCYIATAAGTGYAVGDQLFQINFWNTGETPPVLRSTIWRNQTTGAVLTAPPTFADLTSCGASNDSGVQILCDTNGGLITRFLRRYIVDSLGNLTIKDTDLEGITAYVPAGVVSTCNANDVELVGPVCEKDAAGAVVATLWRKVVYDGSTQIAVGFAGYTTADPQTWLDSYDIGAANVLATCESTSPQTVTTTDECYIVDLAGPGYAASDQIIRLTTWSIGANPPVALDEAWYNQTAGAMLATPPTITDLHPCVVQPSVTEYCYRAISDNFGMSVGDTLSYLRFYDATDRFNIKFSGEVWWNVTKGAEVSGSPITREDVIICQESRLIPACDTGTVGAPPVTCATGTPVSLTALDIQDAEEKNPTAGGSSVNNDDNDLELAGQAEVGETDWQIAVRFNLDIPQGATVCSAYIQFTAEGTTSVGVLNATIKGEAADNSAAFNTVAGSLTARAKTAASVDWNIPLWPTNNAAGADQATPSLVPIVQEIVDRAGWVANNAVAFYFTPGDTGYRRASSIMDGAEAPKLFVTYVAGADEPTTVCTPFYLEVDESGLSTGNNYYIDPADNTWKAYAPIGNIKLGECDCSVSGNSTFQTACFQDSNNVQFIRLVKIDSTTGVPTVVGDYTTDFTRIYTPVGAVSACQGADLEAVDFCMRANTAGTGYAAGDQVKLTRWFNPTTNTQVSEVAFNMTAGGAAVAVPLTAANFDECPAGGEISETLVCAAGVTLIRRADSITGSVTFIGTNGAAVASPGAYTIGECVTSNGFQILCDSTNTQFLRRYVRGLNGTISTVDTTLNGTTAYVPVAPIKVCGSPSIEDVRIFNATGATTWTAALIPPGKTLTALGFSVIVADPGSRFTDSGGTTITGLPAGFSAKYSSTTGGSIVPPALINAGAAGRIIVLLQYK